MELDSILIVYIYLHISIFHDVQSRKVRLKIRPFPAEIFIKINPFFRNLDSVGVLHGLT